MANNDTSKLFSIYRSINEGVVNTGHGTPSTMTVPAPGSLAAGGSGHVKGPVPGVAMASGTEVTASESEETQSEQIDNVKKQLLIIADKTVDIFQCLCDCNKIAPEQINKITIVSDYISSVLDTIKYQGANDQPVVDVLPEEPLGIQSDPQAINNVAQL